MTGTCRSRTSKARRPGCPRTSECRAIPGGVVEEAVRTIIAATGDDADRQGLARTPGRVRRMYAELTAGYHVDPDRLINGAIFEVDYSEMVVVRDIPF